MAGRTASRAAVLAFILVAGGIGLFPAGSGADSWVKNDMGMPFEKGQLFRAATGDGDRDGSPEVYFTGQQAGGVFQYTYDAAKGGWAIENIAGQGFVAGAVVVGDGDDSGDREVYVTGQNREPPRMRAAMFQFFQTGKGWERALVGTTGSLGNDIAIGDGNNDSRTELFSADSDGHIYSYSSSGNSWNIQDVGNSTPGQNQNINPMESVAVGDGDNDGVPEVYGSAADGSVYRFWVAGFGWSRSVVGQGEFNKGGSDMAAIALGDADGDGKNEVYGASFSNATIYMFKYDAGSASWTKTRLGSLGMGVRALSLALGDGNMDGSAELYAGTSNNQVYKVFLDASTGNWYSSSVGSGNGAINGVAVGSATGDSSQTEVYAACLDGHGYQFVVDRAPPANPAVTSDTHPSPGTWYAANIVHVLWQDMGKDVSGIDGYSYYWDSSPATVPDDRKEVEESVHDATSTALSPGKWYFHIRARDKALNWNATATHFGPICIGTAPDTVPPQISNVVVSGVTDKLAVIGWTTNEPADGTVDFGTTAAYGQKAQSAAFVLEHSITLTGLSPSTTYHFRVGSKDSSGNGPAESGDLYFSTLAAPDATPPSIFNVRVSGITDRLAVVSWETDEPADSAAEYGIAASYGLGVSDGKFLQLHELSLTGLNASTVYHFRVLSKDATGNGPAASPDLTFSTLAGPDTVPPVLTNVRVEQVKQDSAIVLWETDEVADSFVEYGQTASYGQSSADRSFLLYHSVLLQGLSPDRGYHLRALSADSSGNTGMGTDLAFRTEKGGGAPDTAAPIISGVTVSGLSDTRAVIMWNTNELADSEVEYGNDTTYGLRATDASDAMVHSIVLDGLGPMTEYHFRVRSTDVFGNGPAASPDMRFTTAGNPDVSGPVISNVKVSNITRTGATVTWTTNEPSDSVLEFGNSTSYGQRLTSKLNVISHSVTVSGLSPGRVYHFRVGSTDPAGNPSSPGADRTFTTRVTGGTIASAPFPWLWVVVAVLLVAVAAAGAAAYLRRGRKARQGAMAAPFAPAGAAGNAGTRAPAGPAGAEVEVVETLQMDAGGQAPSDGGWEEEGAAAAAPAWAAAPAVAAAALAPRSAEPAPVRHIRCPKCRTRIPLYTDGPTRIHCSNCGTTGEYRPRGQGAGNKAQGAGTGMSAAARPVVPMPGPVAPPANAPGPAAAAPAASAPARMTRCSNCGSPVPIYSTSVPVRITCPGCGKAGIYKGPRS